MHLDNQSLIDVQSQIADHLIYACLDAHVNSTDLRMVCAEAEKFKIGSVLVNPVNVFETVKYLQGTGIKVDAVIAYPIGAYPPQIKQFEMLDAIENGATGITMLSAIGRILDGLYDDVQEELTALTGLPDGITGCLMIEATALTFEQRVYICRLAANAGIKAVIPSTGFERSGFAEITPQDVRQLVQLTGRSIDIHALRYKSNMQEIHAYLQAGAKQIITSSVREVMQACQTQVRDVVQ